MTTATRERALPIKAFDLRGVGRRAGWDITESHSDDGTTVQLLLSTDDDRTVFDLTWSSKTSTSRPRMKAKTATVHGEDRPDMTYTDIAAYIADHPTPIPELSPYDFMEMVVFQHKVEWERSFPYAWSNYGPKFEDPALAEYEAVRWKFSRLYSHYKPKVLAWREKVGGEKACDLHNAHVDEERQRREDACLFGIRCTDGYVITCDTEESRGRQAAYMAENAGKGWREPASLLHREVPGGEWTEVPV
ncbi:hypothetical protein [Streptomyces sp. NPDC005407]|uniref:hypothetical protein n=1 Tax=Streptomyces sp. NPDC005407 TaxID=3155340 RepID=UPI0033BB5B67